MFDRLESYLEPRYGRLLTKEELAAQFRENFSNIDWYAAFHPPRTFPKGHIREYDPDGLYTYKDQNPRFKALDEATQV